MVSILKSADSYSLIFLFDLSKYGKHRKHAIFQTKLNCLNLFKFFWGRRRLLNRSGAGSLGGDMGPLQDESNKCLNSKGFFAFLFLCLFSNEQRNKYI